MKLGINFLLWTVHVDEQYFSLFDKLKAVGYECDANRLLSTGDA